MKLKDISAMLDSNGNQVKMDKVFLGPPRRQQAPIVGEVYKFNGHSYRITKVLASRVHMDLIDKNGDPVPGHSDDMRHEQTISRLMKQYQKIK